MPFPRERRPGRLLVGGIVVTVALSVVGVASPSYAVDDYPYRGLGQCPLVPLPKPPKPAPGTQAGTQPAGPANGTTKPGTTPHAPHAPHQPNKPGTPGTPGTQGPPGTSGTPETTTPQKPPPPRECAKHIWFYNGTYGDPWGFALRNCTSFVAWRLRETNGDTDFSNHMDGSHWGDAWHWDDNASALGYLVDDVPAVGAIAQTDDGRIGHVAWVSAVGDGTVTVEEYNYYTPGGYDSRTVPTSDFRYLHVDDLAPAPYLGSTRAAATAVDLRGLSWTARTTPSGNLIVRRPSGHDVRVGAAGAWSPDAAPSVVADTRGRIWVAGVSRDGRLLLSHTTTASLRWSRIRQLGHGVWSTTSTPTLSLDGHGRVGMFAVTSAGALVERHAVRPTSDRWSMPRRMGRPGSWSPQAAPAVATDALGRTWLAAVTRHGSLQIRHTVGHRSRWTGFRAVDGRTWSATSTPALTTAADGRLWLAAVTSRGTLVSRHTGVRPGRWHGAADLGGLWSPYSSPTITADDAGRLWLASVSTGGSVVVRGAAPKARRWGRQHTLSLAASVTDSAALTALPSGGMRAGALTTDGALASRRLGVRMHPLAGSRRGGFSARPPLGL
jgi:surface antigen